MPTKEKVRAFLAAEFPNITLNGDALEFAGAGISSIELIELAVGIEREFRIRFTLAEMNEKTFGSLEEITRLVAERSRPA
jgi:acyl carrier protein